MPNTTFIGRVEVEYRHRDDVRCPLSVCIPTWEPDHWVQVPAIQDPALQEDEATPVSGVTSGATAPAEAPVTIQFIHTTTVQGTPTYYLKSSDGMRWQVEEYSRDGKTIFAVSTWTDFGWEIVIHHQVTQRISSAVEDSVRVARHILVA